jgi:hypothetical protein
LLRVIDSQQLALFNFSGTLPTYTFSANRHRFLSSLLVECGECDPSTCTGRAREEPKFYWYVIIYISVIFVGWHPYNAPHRTCLDLFPSSAFFASTDSGCRTCDNGVWDRSAGGYSCGARISWAMIVDQETQADACAKVADQYPQCVQCTY